jgi:hypothetical protein
MLIVAFLLLCSALQLSSEAYKIAPNALHEGVDLNFKTNGDYSAWPAYGRSKLANLFFAQ